MCDHEPRLGGHIGIAALRGAQLFLAPPAHAFDAEVLINGPRSRNPEHELVPTPIAEVAGMILAEKRIVVIATDEPEVITAADESGVLVRADEADAHVSHLHNRVAGLGEVLETSVDVADESPEAT